VFHKNIYNTVIYVFRQNIKRCLHTINFSLLSIFILKLLYDESCNSAKCHNSNGDLHLNSFQVDKLDITLVQVQELAISFFISKLYQVWNTNRSGTHGDTETSIQTHL